MADEGPGGAGGLARNLLIAGALASVAVLLIAPLSLVFVEAFGKGVAAYLAALARPDTLAAIELTLVVTAIVVPLNTGFGIAAAWCIAKFEFPGRNLLTTLIELPLSVSPVIAGMVFVLVFGAHGWLGPYLIGHGVNIVFAVPGIVLATLLVTLPYVARQLIPLMQQQGRDEEEAAIVLGAGGWQTFRRVTLPNIRWALVYGILICNARALGEFGAVSVVSGHIRGLTDTMPLEIEILYNEYNIVGAFAVASLLACAAVGTLIVKHALERTFAAEIAAVGAP
jgi:sulfate/thiosulfate transport system permease protein